MTSRPAATKRKPARATATAALAVTTLKRAGGSLVMTVPARARDALRLNAGDALSVRVEGAKLVLEPTGRVRPKYTLAQLLEEEAAAKVKPAKPLAGWTDEPQGGEIW